MAKIRETSTDKGMIDLGSEFSAGGPEKKPNWVSLAQLDGPLDDSLANRLLYKPALRFHGITGGLWGQGLSDAPSVPSDPPPSYRFAESLTSRQPGGEACSTCDVDTLYNTVNVTAQSPLTLRRRNTVAVILVAIALLAAVAAVTGVILHFLHPKAMLRANVRFTIANRNHTDDMGNKSSIDFHDIARPLCQEMDVYFLTSELADFYLGCNVVSMRKDASRAKNGTEVHYALDFIENKVSNDAERIKNIIMRKSGRHKTEDTLYLTIRDFLVYLRSLRVGVEVLPLPNDHPGRKHRPRIPWNDGIDFISRKSNGANTSSVNESVLIDIKQLTNNLTEKLDRKTVDMLIDIPKHVLPGGEINELPFLTPTRFHPSATPHQQAHALYFSSIAERMPLFSHMFKNVSVSMSTNVYNKHSVLHGVGAFINPSRASVYLSEIESKHISTVAHAPSAQEMNVKNGIIAQKLRPANYDEQRIHRHDNMFGQIEASFHDISENFNINLKATEFLQVKNSYTQSEQVTSENNNQKIFTIFTDVFLIIGSNSDNTETLKSTKSTMTEAAVEELNQLNEFIEDKVYVEKKPRPATSATLDFLPREIVSENIPVLLKMTTVSVDELLKETLIVKPSKVFDTRGRIKKTSSVNIFNALQTSVLMDKNMQMNEVMVDLPTQEAAVPIARNIEWINIFNVPQRTVKVHVGNIKSNSGIIPVNNVRLHTPLYHKISTNKDVAVTELNQVTKIQEKDTSVSQNIPRIVWENLRQNKLDNTFNRYPNLPNKHIFMDINNALQRHSNVNISRRQDTNVPKVTGSFSGRDATNRNGYYGPFFDNIRTTQTFGNADVSGSRIRNTVGSNITSNIFSGKDIAAFPFPEGQIAHANDVTGSTSNKNSFPKNNQNSNLSPHINVTLQTVRRSDNAGSVLAHNFNLNSRRKAFIVAQPSKPKTNVLQNIVPNSRSIRQNINQQPWSFLNKIGVDLALFDTDKSTDSQGVLQNTVISGKNQQPFQGQEEVLFDSRDRKSKWSGFRNLNHRTAWRQRNIVGNRFQLQRSMKIDRYPFYPGIQMRFSLGLPKSPDFSDIEDMKEILRRLVDNMYNMTTKIDHMQDAINFINKTFHETHKPLFNLEETLGNMTVSLGNLNENLNNINATMNAFKEFLKQFGNTVFNIDDVMKYIDETIGNLGNAVSYIENSMTDLNGTVNGIAENVVDVNETLTYVNRSVLDVDNTATYSNQTLDSMKDTLISLENAVSSLALKVHIITDEADVMDISLKNINDTVKNTHSKLNRLNGKMLRLNSNMIKVETQVHRLNDTYIKINKTLQNMNEPYMFINGTVLEVIQKLSNMDGQLVDLHKIMDIVTTNITSMNMSLLESIDWMEKMVNTLTDFNLWYGNNNNTIKISLRNKGMIETLGMLLNMNGTLSDIGHKVDDINVRLDKVDEKLHYLEEQLSNLDRTLDNIDVTFKLIDKTLQTINGTVIDTTSSLNVINLTVQAMELTFNKVDVSFGNINDTLDSVDKTLTMIDSTGREINLTIFNVNNTFTDLADTIDETTKSAKKLTNAVSTFTGSVSDMNAQLYNANESLRIIKNKADIASESYRLLNKTLHRADRTLSELRTKLIETNLALQYTNTSLIHVNDSLLGIQDSFQSLRAELADVQNSFIKMKTSMQGFGSAFPNIQHSIQDAQKRMSALQLEITEIDDKLHDRKITRDTLVKKHGHLREAFESISDMISLIQISADEVKNRSIHIYNDLVLLYESVNEATDIYDMTERNVRYINKTHNKLKDKYSTLQKQANTTDMNLETIKQDVDLLRNNFKDLQHVLKNYSNIDVQIDLLLSSFDSEAVKYETAKEKFKDWTERFKSVDEILWDSNGNPSGVHDDFKTLVNKTELTNTTSDKYKQIVSDTDAALIGIAKFKDDMSKKLMTINNIRNKIDAIEETGPSLNKNIADTDERIKDKHANLTDLLDTLYGKLDNLQNLRDKFGDINGTFNSVDSLEILEGKIKSTISELQDVKTALNNTGDGFRQTVDKYKLANNTYHNNVFDLSRGNDNILNSTLMVMEESKLQITDTSMDLDAITKSLDDIYNKVKNVDNEIDNLKRTLTHKKKKNNFVSSNRAKMEIRFNISFEKFNETNGMQKVLLKLLEELKDKAILLDKHIGGITNINMSTLPEKTVINQLLIKARDFDEELFAANDYLNTFYERFVQFEEDQNTLIDVKKEYDQYKHANEHFGAALKNISSTQSAMFIKARKISETFEYLLRQLDDFEGLERPITMANDSLGLLQLKLQSTFSNVSRAVEDLIWLKDKFDTIKRNYTNFTTTNIDLTESYVIEAINKIDDHLLNITSQIQLANMSVIDIQSMFDDTDTTYRVKIYDRGNIESTIQSIIHPNLKEINERNKRTNINLDKVNSAIQRIEWSLKGINETIHTTNKQLFVDRQKQLLSDTKIQELELSAGFANESLTASSNSLDETRNNLENTLNDFKMLKERLENYPSVNISLDEFGVNLRSYNDTLETMYKRLNKNFALLNEVNKTIWLEDGKGYSNNESVSDMKNRYKQAEDLLDKILTDITDINSITELVKNGTNKIKKELSSLNASLHDLDGANIMLQKLDQGLTPLGTEAKEIGLKVQELEQNFSNVDETFNKLIVRFTDINESIYSYHVVPFQDDELQVNYSINSLSNETDVVVNRLKEAHELFDLLERISTEKYDSKEALDNSINFKRSLSKNISKIIDEVSKRLYDIRNNISDVEPSIQQLDVRLIDMEDIFSRQQKIEYFENNFPTLKAKAELAKKLLLNSSGFLDRSHDNFENVTQLSDSIKARLERYPSVNVSLAFIDDTLQLSNDSLNNNSNRLSLSFDRLNKANQSLWTDIGENYSDNESISEMKKRFKSAGKVFDNILTDVVEFDNISSTVNIMTNSATTEIDALNESLNYFDKTNNLTDHLIKKLSNINSSFGELHEEISELKNNVSRINKTFDETLNRYKDIKSVIFNTYSSPFQVDLSGTFEDVEKLYIDLNDASKKLTQANQLLDLSNILRQKTLISKLSLDSAVSNNSIINTNVTKLLSKVKLVVPDIKRNISDARRSIRTLKVRLAELENIFRRQEKVEYFDEYFPRKKYDSLNDTITNITEKNDLLQFNMTDVAESLENLKNILDMHEYINVDTSPVDKSLSSTDRIVIYNSESLKNISEDYIKLEQLLYADDGSFISDNETIDEMKNRYEVIGKRIDTMNAKLEDIKSTILQRSITVEEDGNKIKELQSLLDSYENVKEGVNALKRKGEESNNTVVALKDLNSERAKAFRYDNVAYENLSSSFSGTTSDSIIRLKLKIDENIKSLEGHISQLEDSGIALSDNISVFEKLIESYSDGLLTLHEDIKPLKHILLNFSKVNDTGNNIVASLIKKCDSVNQTGINIDYELIELTNDIEKLRLLFNEQEKQDFIKSNSPQLLDLLAKTKEEINQTKLETQGIVESSRLLNNLYEAVNNITADESSLEISLIPNRIVIQSVRETIPRFKDYLDEGKTVISSIDMSIFDESGIYFNKNDTIEDIKEAFEKLNRTIQNIGKNLSLIQNETDELLKGINKENIFLRTLNEETLKLQKLHSTHTLSKVQIHDLGNSLAETKLKTDLLSTKIEYLEESLNDVVRTYGDVKEPSLHHDISLLYDEIRHIKENRMIVKNLTNNTSESYNDTSIESTHLENTITNVSRTLEELQTKISIASPVNKQISKDIMMLKSNITNITDSVEVNLNTIPRTNKSIADLRERFRRQQIYEYIKENFPTLLEEYADVNRTLNNLDIRIPDVSAHLQVFKTNNSDIIETLSGLGLHQISFDDTLAVYKHQNETFSSVVSEKTSLENMFNNFQDVISNNFDSNETLEDIKKRFTGYETTLHDMNQNLKVLHRTLDSIDLEISKALNTTRLYNEALDKYENVLQATKEEDKALTSLGNLMNKTNNDLEIIENTAESQQTRVAGIGENFINVNSSVLHEEKTAIENNLKDATDALIETQIIFKEEINKFDKLVKNNDNVRLRLIKNVTSIEQLQTITNEASSALDKLSSKRQIIQLDTEKTRPNISIFDVTFARIETDIDNLYDKYLEKEKGDFIISNLPQLLSQYNDLNTSLANTMLRLSAKYLKNTHFNQSISQLQNRINSLKNIDISTRNETFQHLFFKDNITDAGVQLNETNRLFGDLYTSIFERTDWSNFTIEDVKKEFDTLRNNISLVNATLINSNTVIDIIDVTLKESLDDLNHTSSVLDRYDDLVNASVANENGLELLSHKLGETDALLEDVKKRFYYDGDRLFNLTRQYPTVKNIAIEKVINETRLILEGKVGLRIPLANKLFSNRIMENYNVVSDRFDDVVFTLNENYTTKHELETILGDAEDTLNNVTLETENMVSSEKFYREDAIRLSELLTESNALLNKLEEMYEIQMKSDLLHESMPNLTKHWNIQNARLQIITGDLNATTSNIADVKHSVDKIDDILNNITTVTLPTGNIHNNLTQATSVLKTINGRANDAKEMLDKIPVFDIDIHALASDRTVSVSDIREQMVFLNQSLQESDKHIKGVENTLREAKDNVSSTNDYLTLMNDTLSVFKDVEREMKDLNESLNNTTTKFNDTYTKLKNADSEMSSYKESLEGLRQKYQNHKYDSSDIDIFLRVTDDKMTALNKTLLDSKHLLSEAEGEYNGSSVKLYTITDDVFVLNESVQTIKSAIPVTSSKVNGINKALDNITNNIPDINTDLQDLKDMLQLMNETLINEDLKSNFAENALPVLEEKYRITNRTFEMTNKTLQKMANELEMLNNYVETLKLRMKDFSTINISMSDIDANITYLENRLVIMQDHYNNVKDIVNTFQKDVSVNNIFGRNISLSDVEDQYKTFNNTLDLINGVLSEIDYEAFEMEEHFETLNDTMYKIDHALDSFEKKQMNTKIMENEIELTGKDILETNNSINEMQNTVKEFSKAFEDMRVLYADVFDPTTENNTLVDNLITNMNKSLVDLHSVMIKLDEMHVKNTDDFGAMNETLFKTINTYADLNNTLDDVKNKLLKLSKSIHKLQRDIDDAKQETFGKNSTLLELSDLLQSLNDSLFREQVKHDFIKNNLGSLEEKFRSLKSPVEAANQTLFKVTEKISNTTDFVQGVAEKLKNFSNVHISLGKDIDKLTTMKEDVSRISDKLLSIEGKYENLQSNITQLDDRSGDMNEIVGQYSVINETLDKLQDNLTGMLTALDSINFDTDVISNRSKILDSSLHKLDELSNSAFSLNNTIVQLEDKLDNTRSTLLETESTTNDLKQTLVDMKLLYSSLDDQVLLDNLLALMEKVNETSLIVKNEQSFNDDLMKKTTDTGGTLEETQARLKSDIHKQKTLDDINTASDDALKSIQNETDVILTAHNKTENKVNELQNTIEVLKYEILRLNETLAEEKRKKEFIADNFPEMEERYNLLNSLLDGSNKNINDASEQVDNVANSLSSVKDRLENITAIAIPLNSENDEVLRIKKEVKTVKKAFQNVSDIYNDLSFQNLNNLNTSFDNLVDTYTGFDQSMLEIEKTINKMNNALDDLNRTTIVIKESVNDINSTVDEYIKTGEKIAEVLGTGNRISAKIGNTNKTVANLSDEVKSLANSLQELLVNYSHIKDPEIVRNQDLIKQLLKSSNDSVRNLETTFHALGNDDNNSHIMMQSMNDTFISTKQLLRELKQHIKDVKNTSSILSDNLIDMEIKRKGINESAAAVTPELKTIFEKLEQLTDKYVKEQKKLDLIATNKPIIEERFKKLQKPLEETNKHISLTEVKLADLKYTIKTVGSRLDKFSTLNITTDPELQTWNNLSQNVKNISITFQNLSKKYERLHQLVNSIEDRNMTIDEMKKKFSDINITLDNVEDELKNLNKKLTNVENEISKTESVLNGLQTSMDNFKTLQSGAAKTKQHINAMQSTVISLENRTQGIGSTNANIKDRLETMKTAYAVLNNTNWNMMLPKFNTDLTNHEKRLKEVNTTLLNQQLKLNSTTFTIDTLSAEINNNQLGRHEIDQAVSSLQKKLDSANEELNILDKPLNTNNKTLMALKAATDNTQKQVDKLNATLHNDLMKYNYVKQNLPSLKEKHSKVNASFVENIPKMDGMEQQIANLVSIIQRIKEKMSQFGVEDTDNSLKKWDLAIAKLNTTVAAILKKNRQAGEKLVQLKSSLWSNDTMFNSQESLSGVIARFEGYNKTLDDINAVSHTINIKLADLDSAASKVIGQLMERDSILTTTPATTTPSGPPEWLTFHSTVSGSIGKDPGFVECSAEDLNEWEMMKITRVNKDGREEPIAAWKLGAGARKAVRDRRIRVKRAKTATGGKLSVGIQTLQCEDEGTYYCSIDSYSMWPLESSIGVVSPPEDDLKPDFPTEVFEDKVANFSCTGHPGYPNGRMTWQIKREKEVEFRPFDFYSSKAKVADTSCIRTETNTVEYQFDLQWNNTKVRCYIENTDFYAEGIIRLLPYDICNRVRYLGTISHPYTPHKYIVCGKELNIMQCPGNTCYDEKSENCVRCKAGHAGGGDPCLGQPLFSYVAHETDCKKYYICMGPTKTTKKCTKGYFAPNIPGNCVMSYAQSHCGRKAG